MSNKVSLVLLIFAVLLFPSITLASRAGLVVKHSTGVTKELCVEFEGDFVTGLDLLRLSGVNPVLDEGFVVEIDGERTKSAWDMVPGDPYWSYWFWDNGWHYSNLGPVYFKVKEGDIQGWEMGGGTSSLPDISFENVCKNEAFDEKKSEDVASDSEIGALNSGEIAGKTDQPLPKKEFNNQETGEVRPVRGNISNGVKVGSTDQGATISKKDRGPDSRFDLKNSFKTLLEFNAKNALIVFAVFYLGGMFIFFVRHKVKIFLS